VTEDYGVMAVASAISTALVLFSDLGSSLFLLQHKNAEDPNYFNTAWTISALRGILLWLAMILVCWPISYWYNAPVLAVLIPALGLSLVMSGFNSTELTLRIRRLDPALVVLLNIATAFFGAALSTLWVVYVYADVWGLVVGNVGSSILLMVLSHYVLRGHKNWFCWDRDAASELFRMSRWVIPASAVTFLADQADRLLVAALVGMHEVGLYHLSAQLCQLPSQLLATFSSSLLLPFFSEQVRKGCSVTDATIHHVRRLYLGLGTTMTLALLLLGPTFAELLFGNRFRGAGWMIQVLSLSVAFRSFGAAGGQYLKALGRLRSLAAADALKVPVVFAMPPLLTGLFGTAGFLASFVFADALRYAATAYFLQRAGIPGLRDDMIALTIIAAAGVAVLFTS